MILLKSAKYISAGLSIIKLKVGIGIVFGALAIGIFRNPSKDELF